MAEKIGGVAGCVDGALLALFSGHTGLVEQLQIGLPEVKMGIGLGAVGVVERRGGVRQAQLGQRGDFRANFVAEGADAGDEVEPEGGAHEDDTGPRPAPQQITNEMTSYHRSRYGLPIRALLPGRQKGLF